MEKKVFIHFLTNKKEVYSNEYFHSFFYAFIRILGVFIGHTMILHTRKHRTIGMRLIYRYNSHDRR